MTDKYATKRQCPVCEGNEAYLLAHLRYAIFDDLEMSGDKTFVQCYTCGMLFDDIHFSDKQLEEYYKRNEHYSVSLTGGSGSISEENKIRYDRIISLLEPVKNGVILDLGCGQGGFVYRCIEHGLKAFGIEPSVKSRKVAHDSGLYVYESMDEFLTENPGCKVHAVIFSHVLEHLIKPLQLLRIVAKYAKDALVYIEVPDADSYLSSGNVRWQEMYFEHISHFCKNDIAELAKRSWIKIKREGEIPFSYFQEKIRCRFLVGQFTISNKTVGLTSNFSIYERHLILHLPVLQEIPRNDQPLALWGVSQYAMLLLGSYPELLTRMRCLFDSSPAKIGRTIKGIIIEHSDNISSLADNYLLLIPKSLFLFQMHDQLSTMGFKGRVINV